MAAKRKYFITHGSIAVEMFPISIGAQKYSWQREQDQIFKRKKLINKLRFKRDNGEFNYFTGIEFTSPCDEIKIEVRVLCMGSYVTEWRGVFSTGGGYFDFDQCYFEVLPEPDDVYRCILANWDKEFNIFDYTVDIAVDSPSIVYETLVGNTIGAAGFCGGLVDCTDAPSTKAWYQPDYTSEADMIAKGWCVLSHTVTNEGEYTAVEVDNTDSAFVPPAFVVGDIITETGFGNTAEICKIDNFITPANRVKLWLINVSSGFTAPGNLIDNTPSGGTAEGNSITYTHGDLCSVSTIWESQLIQIACVGSDCATPGAGYYLISADCLTTGYCTFRRCPEAVTSTDIRGVFYNTLLDSIINALCGDIFVKSIFFDLNPDVTDPHYSVGINYMTGLANKVAHLLISQKSDVIDPLSINPATIGNVTLKQLLQWAREVFNVYWDIALVGGLPAVRIEHFDFFTSAFAIDLTLTKYLEHVAAFNKYEHLKSAIPRNEIFKFVDSGGFDFRGKDIIYSDLCSTVGQSVTHEPEGLSTDLGYIENNTSLSPDGFVMIATDLVGSQYLANAEAGEITGFVFSNAHLSWANLHKNYHRWNRYLSEGTMNDVLTTFLSWKPNVKQPTLKVLGCCDNVNPEGYAKTNLGETIINKHAFIDKMELDFTSDMLSFDLTYSI